jgi:SHS2 domain-containing protein
MQKPGFEEIEHTADWALRVKGVDLIDLLCNAARGLLHLAGIQPQTSPVQERVIEIHAPDQEILLVSWLEELLFAIETRNMTFINFELRIRNNLHLTAHVQETPIETLTKHIKAVTYHDLKIIQTNDGLEVTVVFDV